MTESRLVWPPFQSTNSASSDCDTGPVRESSFSDVYLSLRLTKDEKEINQKKYRGAAICHNYQAE